MKKSFVIVIILLIIFGVSHTMEQKVPVSASRQEWLVEDSKAYARDVMLAWEQNQYKCLIKLWTKESNWRPDAYNKTKVMGKNAGGIPQLLGMSPKLAAPLQIDRGFDYIMHRYGTPCMAWKFHQRRGWY